MKVVGSLFKLVILVVILCGTWYLVSPLFTEVEVQEDLPSNSLEQTSEETIWEFATMSFDEAMDVVSDKVMDTMSEEMPVTDEDIMKDPKLWVIASSDIVSHGNHFVEGFALFVQTDDARYLRYEDFTTINGPNLHIYLATDLTGKDFIDLGPIKWTKWNINYKIPDGVDLTKYRYALHRCVPFSVLFNSAEFTIGH